MNKKLLLIVCICLFGHVEIQSRFVDVLSKIGARLRSHKIPDRFKPAETWPHPPPLLHGSPDDTIELLQPKALGNRCNGRPVVFATQHFGLAAVFMQTHKGKFACGRLPNDDIFFMTNDKKRCIQEDRGGAIYVVPSATFFCEAHVSLGVDEWLSYTAVRPLAKFSFKSALDAMLDLGVKVYFADSVTYSRYWRLGSSDDDWIAFFRHLRPLTRKQLEVERNALGIENS